MPVVTVVAPPHPANASLLSAVADAVARALVLGAGDVIAIHVPSGAGIASGGGVAHWRVLTISGTDRGSERMEAARVAASAAVTDWCAAQGVESEGVWTQWQTP